MKPQPNFFSTLPDVDEAPLHFRSFEISGRQLLADGESLHELAGYERRPTEDGGVYDAALV